jgi:hypothetical protein
MRITIVAFCVVGLVATTGCGSSAAEPRHFSEGRRSDTPPIVGPRPGQTSCNAPTPGVTPFVDATAAVGLDFVHHHTEDFCTMADVIGGGACLFDYDLDGDVDLFLTDRAPFGGRLYENDGGTFADVTADALPAETGDGIGCLAFDADSDGDLDLYLANNGADRLLRNDGGVFVDVTEAVGLVQSGLSASATAGDLDGDGDLDLVVSQFVDVTSCGDTCPPKPDTCSPARDLIFENRDGQFVEIGLGSGVDGDDLVLATTMFDIDDDGDLDIYLGSDVGRTYPDRLYVNDGVDHFVDRAADLGLAWNGTGTNSGSTMGVTIGDYDRNGVLDVASSNFEGDPALLFKCDEGPTCFDAALSGNDLGATRNFTGWALRFEDFDQDGWLDLFVANGRVIAPAAQPNLLLWSHEGHFAPHAAAPDDALALARNSRGAAFGDIDGDGDVDAVVASNGEAPQVLLNTSARGNYLLVELDTLSAGARVTVDLGDWRRTQPVLVGDGYLGSSDPRVHFGLGPACSVDVTIEWLDGTTRVLTDVAVNQVLRVERSD